MEASRRILEVCVDSVESAVNAAAGGADRLELCGALVIGGVTPDRALYERIRERVDIPIHVLLRPRFGDFLYSEEEFEILKRQTKSFREAGADALVIGCLTADGRLDKERLQVLREIAGETKITLHRAFDMTRDLDEALAEAKELGAATILTSGGCASALEGWETLKRLREHAGSVEILAGAGIGADAITALRARAGITSFHMSGKRIVDSRMAYRNSRVSMGLPQMSEYEIWQTDAEAVRAARAALEA